MGPLPVQGRIARFARRKSYVSAPAARADLR